MGRICHALPTVRFATPSVKILAPPFHLQEMKMPLVKLCGENFIHLRKVFRLSLLTLD